ncbi:MAG: LysR family transcriptional regulator [Rhizobiales bacterium]|nr:LysR family transcriptional regulator [Hyphomicrobiales bacterium]
MELSDLHVFRTVVEAGGITRAAEKLNRVQSNVTTRIRQLEQELGVSLFIRDGKRLHLSPAGQVMLGYAERLLDLAREARESVHDTTPRGLFRFIAPESTTSVRLPTPLSEYCRRYPDVTLELRTGVGYDDITNAIITGTADAGIAIEPIPDAPFEKLPIYNEELVLIATAGHPPIRSARDALSRTVLVFERGCPYRKRLEEWFALTGDMPERMIEITSYHAMLGCAVVGMGISFVPRMVLDTFPDRDRLSIHQLPPELRYAQSVMLWRKGARSPKLSALADILASHAAGINAREAPRTRKVAAAAAIPRATRSRRLQSR